MPETALKLPNNLANKTLQQYDRIIAGCKDIYMKKIKDYGTSWRMLRPRSLTDQIFIKAKRILNIEEMASQKIEEGIDSELMGIINYSLIALIQLELKDYVDLELSEAESERLYDEQVEKTRSLMQQKNHDYGEALRYMRVNSLTDIILSKIMRIKHIEDNAGATHVSEGVEGNYFDMLNYSVFALIHLENC